MSLCASGGVREGCLEEVTQGASMVGQRREASFLGKTVGFHGLHWAPRRGRRVWAGLCPRPRLCSAVAGPGLLPLGQAVLSLSSGAAGAGRWAARAESPVLMAAPSLAENSTLWGGGPGAAGVAVLTSLNRWRGALGQGGVPVPEGRRALSEPLHRAAVSVRPSVCPLGAGMPVLGPSLPRWLRWWEGASPSSAGGSQGPEGPV